MLRRTAIAAVCVTWLGCDVYTPDLLEPSDGAGGSTPPSSTSAGGAGGAPGGGMGAGGMNEGAATSTTTTTSTMSTGGMNEGGQGGDPPIGGEGGTGGSPPLGPPWINELHYDNASADAGEGVEIAGPAQDVAGWTIVAYNGNGGGISGSASTVTITGSIPNQMNGFGTRWFPMPGLENGAPDGIALVDDAGVVVQFLSYEGSFAATAGPANGTTSTNLPVDEEPAPAVGMSLQLTGTGSSYADFTWVENVAASPDQINAGQQFP